MAGACVRACQWQCERECVRAWGPWLQLPACVVDSLLIPVGAARATQTASPAASLEALRQSELSFSFGKLTSTHLRRGLAPQRKLLIYYFIAAPTSKMRRTLCFIFVLGLYQFTDAKAYKYHKYAGLVSTMLKLQYGV